MTVDDPEWDDDDRDAALLWQAEENLRCSCGQPLDESTDPEKAANAYLAEPVVCNACAARERKANALTEDGKKPLAPGTKFRVRDQSRE